MSPELRVIKRRIGKKQDDGRTDSDLTFQTTEETLLRTPAMEPGTYRSSRTPIGRVTIGLEGLPSAVRVTADTLGGKQHVLIDAEGKGSIQLGPNKTLEVDVSDSLPHRDALDILREAEEARPLERIAYRR